MIFFLICLSNNFKRYQSFALEEGEDHIREQEEEPEVDGEACGQGWTKYFSQTKIFNTSLYFNPRKFFNPKLLSFLRVFEPFELFSNNNHV